MSDGHPLSSPGTEARQPTPFSAKHGLVFAKTVQIHPHDSAKSQKRDDYFAAKAAWEKEHPGELYSTTRHYKSGTSARVLADYWTHYSESASLKCETCGWEGLTRDGNIEPHAELFDVSCPTCGKMLLIVPYPTAEETRAAAAAGNVAAQREPANTGE